MPDAQALYDRAPRWAQNAVCNVVGAATEVRRYRGAYPDLFAEARVRETWSEDRVLAYRDRRLADLLRVAATTPHYAEVFARLGGSWQDFGSPAAFASLPVLTKAEVQRAPERFRPGPLPRETVTAHTSGTTGAGLRFLTTRRAQQEQWAVWWRYRAWHGIERGTWCGYFGGRTVVPVADTEPPFWRYNVPARQILFSGQHMSPATLDAYVAELRRRRPPWLHGYPSLLTLLAHHVLARGDGIGYPVRWVTVGAESLLRHQAAAIEQAFGVPPVQHYGAAEAVANVSECERGSLHVDEDFAYVELVDRGDGSADVVGTALSNPATVLLRYAVGDTAAPVEGPCSCGRWGRLVSDVDGRAEDYVVLPDGRSIGRLDHAFKDLTSVREAQIRQRSRDAITVAVVPCETWKGDCEERLLRELRRRLGEAIDIRVDLTDELPRTSTGKLRFVVSDVSGA